VCVRECERECEERVTRQWRERESAKKRKIRKKRIRDREGMIREKVWERYDRETKLWIGSIAGANKIPKP
jgi:hypothetical protein